MPTNEKRRYVMTSSLREYISGFPDSHNFIYYHWIRGYINHAHAEIARVEIR